MDKYDSWKRTDDVETDLVDMLRTLCMRWKKIVICALAGAVLLGGYGWVRSGNRSGQEVLPENTGLTEEEERTVADALILREEIKGLKEYLDQSVLIKIDPYHRNRVVMLYGIDQADGQKLQKITESYISYLVHGGAVDILTESGRKKWNIDKSCLAELITAYQKTYSSPYQISVDYALNENVVSQSLFYLEVSGEDADMARKLALDLQSVLKRYHSRVQKMTGEHKLTLVSSQESELADSSLQSWQHDKLALLSSSQSSLKTMTDAFSAGQKMAYVQAVGDTEELEIMEGKQEEDRLNIRYVILGSAAGIFIYCCIFGFQYLFQDTVKNVEEMKKRYAFPVYRGPVLYKNAAADIKGEDGGWETAQMLNRIRIACKKHGITRLYAVSDYFFNGQEKAWIERITKQLGSWGIEIKTAENAGTDIAVWDAITQNGNVLIVCKTGVTTHGMIDEEMRFCIENEVAVAGAIVFRGL